MFTHHTPATLDARPNLLKLSESAFFQEVLQCFANVVFPERRISRRSYFANVMASRRSCPRAKALKCVCQENACANQAHNCCNRFDHRQFPLTPVATERPPRCTVKRISLADRRSDATEDSVQQIREKASAPRRRDGASAANSLGFYGLRKQPLIHHPGALPISAVFHLRYVHTLMQKWAASGMHDRRTLK